MLIVNSGEAVMSQLNKLVSTAVFGSIAAVVGVVMLRDHLMKPPPAGQATLPKAQASAFQSGTAPPSGGNTATLYADSRGHFITHVQVRGIPVKVLVDTGASLVALSTEDAARIGLRAGPGDRKAEFSTANGQITASLVRLPEVRLQNITVFDVEAAIMPPGAMQGTLLGMSFMRKLASFESHGTSMVMRK
jgi:aspartyl protease family protein